MEIARSFIDQTPIGFEDESERLKHCYVIGATGSGKSTLLENLALIDIDAGHPVIFIDPFGSSAYKLLQAMPTHRIRDVIYLDLSDRDYAVGFNPLAKPDDPHLTAETFRSAIVDIWYPNGTSTPRLDWFLLNDLKLLMEKQLPLSVLPQLHYDNDF
jgi:DNA helicase HerA-like ATPase